ncbi:MAG: hypothetical protein V4574_07870 [Pseudomonadota bacterium]
MRLLKAAALLALALALPAAAPLDERDPYVPYWILEPLKDFQPVTVKSHEIFARVRMLPATMLVLDEDYFQDSGKLAAPKGTELIELRTRQRVACAVYPPRLTGGASIMAWGTDRHLCFIDENADGRFDRYFYKQTNQGGFFYLVDRMPKTSKLGTGGKYSTRDPHGMTRALTWLLSVDSCKPERGRCIVSAKLSVPGFDGISSGPISINYAREFVLPLTGGAARLEFYDSVFTVRAAAENGGTVTLERNFTETPFALL